MGSSGDRGRCPDTERTADTGDLDPGVYVCASGARGFRQCPETTSCTGRAVLDPYRVDPSIGTKPVLQNGSRAGGPGLTKRTVLPEIPPSGGVGETRRSGFLRIERSTPRTGWTLSRGWKIE